MPFAPEVEELSGSLSSGDGGDKGPSVWRRYVVSYVPGVAGGYLWQGFTRTYEALIANSVGEGDSKRAFRNVPLLCVAEERAGLCSPVFMFAFVFRKDSVFVFVSFSDSVTFSLYVCVFTWPL